MSSEQQHRPGVALGEAGGVPGNGAVLDVVVLTQGRVPVKIEAARLDAEAYGPSPTGLVRPKGGTLPDRFRSMPNFRLVGSGLGALGRPTRRRLSPCPSIRI